MALKKQVTSARRRCITGFINTRLPRTGTGGRAGETENSRFSMKTSTKFLAAEIA